MDNKNRPSVSMKDGDGIIEKIELLSRLLRNGGKTGPGDFFDSLGKKLRKAGNSVEIMRILLDNVKKVGSISQYATFSENEERLLNEIYDLSEKILEKNQ